MNLKLTKYILKSKLLLFRILSGCYDNTLHLWTSKGKHQLTIPGHTGPIKAVAWVSFDDTMATFVR